MVELTVELVRPEGFEPTTSHLENLGFMIVSYAREVP